MNNSKGFTLVEVMTTLLIVSIVSAVLFPTLVTVYNERISIRQEEVALLHLEKTITNWVYDIEVKDDTNVVSENISYAITFRSRGIHELEVCISWVAANKRNYERCASGKR